MALDIDWVYYLPVAMFACLTLFLLSGFPVAFVLGGVGLGFGFIAYLLGSFSIMEFFNIAPRVWNGVAENLVLVAGPMFIFMGVVLQRSGIAEELLETVGLLMRRVPGGMAVGVVLVGAILGATTGVVSATVVMMTLLVFPSLEKAGFDRHLSLGTIAASGTLGVLIPPSVMLVFMGDILQVSIGKLFIACIVPGLMLATVYCLWILGLGVARPDIAPSLREAPKMTPGELLRRSVRGLVAPLALIFAVLGSIFAGLTTPTESAAIGVAGAIILTILRGNFSMEMLNATVREAAVISAMIFFIIFGATVFSYVFNSTGGKWLILDSIDASGLGRYSVLFIVMLVIFLAGFFFDWIEITLIFLPIFGPVITEMEFGALFEGRRDELVWFAVLVAMNLQTSFLSPPFGFTLFYMRGVAPETVRMIEIYRGVVPFIGLQLVALLLLVIFPDLAMWLPSLFFD